MACDDRQLTEAQRVAGYENQRTGVQRAVRPFSGRPTVENLIDYINRELQPAVRQTRDAVNDVYLQVTDNAPSGNPLGFYFSTETGAADPTAGRVRLNNATQDTATIIRVSESNGRLVNVAPWLDVMAGSVTSPLGVVTLTDAINPGRFIRFDLNTMTDQGVYWDLGVTPIESSHDNPFVDGGAVTVSFIPGVGSTPATIPPTAISGADGPRQFLATSTGTTVDWRTLSTIFPGAPIYDVMAYPFNATGDGVADDLTAINAAIAVALVTPGIVYLGRSHRITGALTSLTTNCIIIQGRGMDTNGTILTCTTSPTAIVTFASGARFSGIRDIRIIGASGATGYAVIFQQAFRCFAHNLRISAVGNGIEIDRCNTTYIENVDVVDPLDDYGFHVHGVDPDFCHVTRFVRCQVGGSGTTYIGFAHGSFAHTVIYQHCGVLQGAKGMYVFDDQGSAPTFIHAWQFSSDHPLTTGIHLEACAGAVMFDQTLATSVDTPGNPGITIGASATRWQFNGGESNQGVTIAGTAGVVRGMHTSTIALASTADEILVEHNHLTGALTIASGADNYVVTGNYVGGGITNTPGRADTRVVFDNIPDTEVAVGSVWGLQIDHGATDVPREVTKFELGENLRRETVVVDSLSSGTSATYAIASTTTQVQFKLAGALTINGMTAATLTFGKLVAFSFDSGFAGSVTWNNESGSAGAALERVRTPGAVALTISAGETALFEYFDSRWRCLAVGKSTVLTDGDKGDITVTSGGTTWTIDNGVVSLAKQANLAQSRIIGRAEGAGTGVPQALTPTQVVAIIDGENATWTGVHSFTGSSHTVNVTGAVNIDADAASRFITSVGNLTLQTTQAASRVIVSGADDVLIEAVADDIFLNSGGLTQLTSGTAITLEMATLFRVTTNGVERLEIEDDGAWQLGGDQGDLGSPMLSQGASSPPIWGDRSDVTDATIIAGGSSAASTIVTLTIPANTLVVGSTYELWAHCRYVRSGSPATSHDVTMNAEANGSSMGLTLIVSSGTQNSNTSHVVFAGTFTCLTAGGSGTAVATLAIDQNIALDTNPLTMNAGSSGPSIDTTASNTIRLRVSFSAGVAGASFDCRRAWIRRTA